jgi:solute:Na+ symporter, SSS family
VQKGSFGGESPKTAADTYTFMLTHTLPWGLKGLVTAAMLAAAMQTCSAALNSTATLFAYDIFQRWRPQTTDHQLVLIGKLTTVAATVLAIAWSPLFSHYNTIYEGLATLIGYLSPPITAVFLVGVFWRRASGKAAYLTLLVGAALGATVFVLDWFKQRTGWNVNFMMASFYLCVICGIVMAVASFRYPEPLKEEAKMLVWQDWREPLRGAPHGHGLGDYRILSGVVLACFVVLYVVFR